MGKIWFLKVLGIYLCVCASLFLFTTYGSGFYTPPGHPPDNVFMEPRPNYPFPYPLFGRQEAYNPYGSYQQPYNPYGYQQSYNPYGYQQSYNPYEYQQSYNPYEYQQSYNPYGYQQSYNPYGYQQPFISANPPPPGPGYPPWLQQSYYPYGYQQSFTSDDYPSGYISYAPPLATASRMVGIMGLLTMDMGNHIMAGRGNNNYSCQNS